MWLRRLKRLFGDHSFSETDGSADDRFDLRLQEFVIAQQHYSLFSAAMF